MYFQINDHTFHNLVERITFTQRLVFGSIPHILYFNQNYISILVLLLRSKFRLSRYLDILIMLKLGKLKSEFYWEIIVDFEEEIELF